MGRKQLPWGTPLERSKSRDCFWLMMTRCFLAVKKDVSQQRAVPVTPKSFSSMLHMMLWSNRTNRVTSGLSILMRTSLLTLSSAVSVEWYSRWDDWLVGRGAFSLQCPISWGMTALSAVLDTKGRLLYDKNLCVPFLTTTCGQKRFSYSAAKWWNDLDKKSKLTKTLKQCKSCLENYRTWRNLFDFLVIF